MTRLPRVSVIIPTYNRADLLGDAIESVLRQTFADHEVVVCDDGSTDHTSARVRAFGAPVRYLQLAHTGRPGAPRNLGIRAARGELIAFLDDDDLWEADKLARQVALVDRDGASLVYTDRRLVFDDGSTSGTVVSPPPASPERLLDLLLDGHFPFIGTVLTRRSLLEQVDGFDETLVTGEDLDLWLRVAPKARAGRVPEPLVLVRRRPGTLSDRSGCAAFRNAIGLLERSLAAGQLSPAQQRRCRATLGRLNARLAAFLVAGGDAGSAVRASLEAVRYAPASPAAWLSLARSGPLGRLTPRESGAERCKS